MKKNKVWYVLVGMFCLVTSGASVYATSYNTQNHVGVGFVDSTSTTSSTTSTTSSSTGSSTSSFSSSSSAVQSSSSLPNTNQKKDTFWWLGNSDGGNFGGTTRYFSDDKFLPKTGELVQTALPFVGIFLIMLIFFYLRKERRKMHE